MLVSPLTGIGTPTEHFHQLFYRAYFVDGLETAAEFADYVQNVISQLGWLVLDKVGNTITDRDQNIQMIQTKVQQFLDSQKLQIAKQLRLFN